MNYDVMLHEMGMTRAEVLSTTSYQQYLLIWDDGEGEDEVAFHFTMGDLWAEYEAGREPALEEGWQELVSELRTMPYTEYLKTPHWQFTAEAVKRRDGHRCHLCNAHTPLHAHHRTYERRGEEPLEDVTALCERCHLLYHERIEQPKRTTPLRPFEPPV